MKGTKMNYIIVALAAYCVACGGFCAFLAEEKKRNGGYWFILGFFFTVIALLTLAATPKKE